MAILLTRQPRVPDVSDEEWAFVLPYLNLVKADARRDVASE